MNVRPATLADVETVVGFNLRLAAESEGRTLDRTAGLRGVEAIVHDPARGRYWIAERQGTACGQCLVTIEPSDWMGGTYWWLQSVYVDPAHRGAGVFRALWDHVARAARETGDVRAIRLYVDRENTTARRVYSGIGMAETAYRVYELPLSVEQEPAP